MHSKEKTSIERLLVFGFGATLAVLLLVGAFAWHFVLPMATIKSVDHSREVIAESGQPVRMLANEGRTDAVNFIPANPHTKLCTQGVPGIYRCGHKLL